MSATAGTTRRRALFRLAAVVLVAVAVVVVGYAGYAFVSGSAEYLAGAPEHIGCDTPMHRFGWVYETINYDIADDEALLAASPDPDNCTKPASTAGGEVVSTDGVHLAGWYIPSEDSIGATGPTIVIVHGGRTNKSGVLDYAPAFHEHYNLLLPDLRNSGRSGGTESTSGLREQHDLRAMLDWLEQTKHPTWIAVMGNSNGAATALAEGLGDQRVRALVLDSMHAEVARQVANVIETERHLPPWPAAWALVAGVSFRVGGDLETVDPIRSLAAWDDRPILLIHGLADTIDRPADSLEPNIAAAIAANLSIEVHVCPGARHGQAIVVCAEDWARWADAFLAARRDTLTAR
jgi:uncharacterized protein